MHFAIGWKATDCRRRGQERDFRESRRRRMVTVPKTREPGGRRSRTVPEGTENGLERLEQAPARYNLSRRGSIALNVAVRPERVEWPE